MVNRQVQDCLTVLKEELNECGEDEEEKEDVVDLADDRDSKLSELWDLSTEPDTAEELCKGEFLEVLRNLLNVSHKPRLLEILVGITGNLACKPYSLEEINKNNSLRESLIRLLTSKDSGVLVETLRLFKNVASLNYQSWESIWELSFMAMGGCESLILIFSSSTNALVLAKASEFLEILLDENSSVSRITESDCSSALLPAILEAIEQSLKDQSVAVCVSLLRCLQEMTTTKESLALLESDVIGAIGAIRNCIKNISLSADFEFMETFEILPLVYGLSVWNSLLSDDICYQTLTDDAQILKETLCFCERLDIQHSSSEHQDEKENVIKLLCKEYQTFKEALLNEMKLRDPGKLKTFQTGLTSSLKQFFSCESHDQ